MLEVQYQVATSMSLPRQIIVRCQLKTDDQLLYKELVGSGVEHKAWGAPQKMGYAGVGCI